MTEEKENAVEQSSVRIFHHFLPPFIPCGIMFGLTLDEPPDEDEEPSGHVDVRSNPFSAAEAAAVIKQEAGGATGNLTRAPRRPF